jgi:mRNA interferase MazF
MGTTVKTSISIQKSLFDQAQILATNLNISRSHLFEMALEHFMSIQPTQPQADSPKELVINQGDIYWVTLETEESESHIPHPFVVIQDNLLNHSRINTVVACALTSNIKRASIPGNLLLEVGEANLPKPSVVEVSKISTIDKTQLGEYIGSLTDQRIHQILAGLRFQQLSFFTR